MFLVKLVFEGLSPLSVQHKKWLNNAQNHISTIPDHTNLEAEP